jgi:hypothetical protein
MKQTRAGFSTANPGLIIGTFKQQLDPVVAKNGNKVDMATASGIVGARMALECRFPVAAAMDAALGTIISKQASAAPAVDIWKDRDIVLTEAMPGKPVTVAIWDSGVDMSLFKAAANPGVAVSWDGKITRDPLLRAAGKYQKDTQRLMDLVKGSMDLQAGQQTAEATAFQTYMRGLKPEQAKEVGESLGFVGNYITARTSPASRRQAIPSRGSRRSPITGPTGRRISDWIAPERKAGRNSTATSSPR